MASKKKLTEKTHVAIALPKQFNGESFELWWQSHEVEFQKLVESPPAGFDAGYLQTLTVNITLLGSVALVGPEVADERATVFLHDAPKRIDFMAEFLPQPAKALLVDAARELRKQGFGS